MQDTSWEYNVKWEKHGHQLLLEHRSLIESLPKDKIFLEIGSDRGEGSTKALAELANELGFKFITVDMNWDLSVKALNIVHKINPKFYAKCVRGEEFIGTLADESIAVLYLDAYDTMPPGADLPKDIKEPYLKKMGEWSNEEAWNMHLKCSMIGDRKLIPGGLVCFDDIWRKDDVWAKRSKGYTAIPWLLEKGYEEIKYVEGCILMRKPFKGVTK